MPINTGISDPNNTKILTIAQALGIDPTNSQNTSLLNSFQQMIDNGASLDFVKQIYNTSIKPGVDAETARIQNMVDSGQAFIQPPNPEINYFSLPAGQAPQAAWTLADAHALQEDARQRALQGIGRVALIVGGTAVGGTLAGLAGGGAGAGIDMGGAGVLAPTAATSGAAGVAAGVPAGTALTAGIPGIAGGVAGTAGGALAAGEGVLANTGLTGVAIPHLAIPGGTGAATDIGTLAAGGLQPFPPSAASGALTGVSPNIATESPPVQGNGVPQQPTTPATTPEGNTPSVEGTTPSVTGTSIPTPSGFDIGQWLPTIISGVGDILGANAQNDATQKGIDAQLQATRDQLAFLRESRDMALAQQQPWIDAGTAALPRLQQMAGLTNPSGDTATNNTNVSDFILQNDPAYNFNLNAGVKAIENSAFARGGGMSGSAGRDILKFAQGYASNEYSNIYNRVAQIAGYGPAAAGTASNIYSNYGANAAIAQGNVGPYLSSAYTAQGNQNANLWTNLSNLMGGIDWSKA